MINSFPLQSGGWLMPNTLQSMEIALINSFECNCKLEGMQEMTEK